MANVQLLQAMLYRACVCLCVRLTGRHKVVCSVILYCY